MYFVDKKWGCGVLGNAGEDSLMAEITLCRPSRKQESNRVRIPTAPNSIKEDKMDDWQSKEFEIKEKPNEGEGVQYAVLHILQLQKLDIPAEEIKFFMREK